jgi:DNA-binding NarL/FixJ family response regulator
MTTIRAQTTPAAGEDARLLRWRNELRQRLGLTGRDLEMLALVVAGDTDEAIAARVDTSPRTVRRRMARLSSELSARSRPQLAAMVIQLGLARVDVSCVLAKTKEGVGGVGGWSGRGAGGPVPGHQS